MYVCMMDGYKKGMHQTGQLGKTLQPVPTRILDRRVVLSLSPWDLAGLGWARLGVNFLESTLRRKLFLLLLLPLMQKGLHWNRRKQNLT